MKNKEYWINWAKKAGVRAIKTVAQTFVATVGTAAVLQDVNWIMVLSASVLAGILSLATSVAGIPEVSTETTGYKRQQQLTYNSSNPKRNETAQIFIQMAHGSLVAGYNQFHCRNHNRYYSDFRNLGLSGRKET